jgi:hypothetical protein
VASGKSPSARAVLVTAVLNKNKPALVAVVIVTVVFVAVIVVARTT